MQRKSHIRYSVHPTPMKPGDSQQTYHVRIEQRRVVHAEELMLHIAAHSMISEGLFEMVMTTLCDEIAEKLLDGNGVHIEGLGQFSLQIGTVKTKDEKGRRHAKTYTSPQQLKAREIVVEGINFIPDKRMMNRLRSAKFSFERRKQEPVSEIPRGELLKTMADYCAANDGCITRHEFQRLFGVTRYRADQILTALVSEEFPKYYRIKVGTLWVYRKTGT